MNDSKQSDNKLAYTFAVMPWGTEVTWVASSEKEARAMAWDALADDAKNGCECLDLVDEVAA